MATDNRGCEQLELFELPDTEVEALWRAVADLKESHRRTQRRLFSELKDLRDAVRDRDATIERLKYLQDYTHDNPPRSHLFG